MAQPIYFPSAAAFGDWLAEHHDEAREVLVGYWRVDSGRPSPTWSESVDEALRFGWIDGVRRRVDDERYTIRFTPRRPGSHWSRINVDKAEALLAAGRMEPAGKAAYAARREDRTAQATHETHRPLEPELQARLEADEAAWTFLQSLPPGYRRNALGWVMLAKRAETRERRLETLLEHARAGERLPQLVSAASLDAGLQALLEADVTAHAFFQQQSPSVRKHSIAYVMAARKPETRLRRLEGMLEKARRHERWW